MALNYSSLNAYIDGLYQDGQLSEQDYNAIIVYILANGDIQNAPRDLIQVRRGNEEDLPILAQGELALTLDTEKLFVGGISGNVLINGLLTSVRFYGAKGDGVTDDTVAFQAALNSGKSVFVPNATYKISNTLSIENSNVKMYGESKGGTILDFTSMISGNAIEIAQNNALLNVNLTDITVKGNTSINGLVVGASISASLVDSMFSRLRFESFAIGLKMTYAWANTFENCRFQSCTKPFELNSQVNSTHFDTCNFVTFTQSGKFSNAEGIVFTNPNISNINVDIGFTLFQSTVIMNSPYFENVQKSVASIGATSEVIKSSLSINGGIVGGNFIIGNDCSLIVDGSRVISDSLTFGNLDVGTPQKFTKNIIVNVNNSKVKTQNVVLDYDYGKRPSFLGAAGGSIRYQNLQRDFATIEQQAVANGFELAGSLITGKQYTLIYAMRQRGDVTALSFRNDQSLGITLPTDSEDWEIRYSPFIANGAVLDLLVTGTLEVKMIKIVEGVVSSIDKLPIIKEWYGSAIPTLGTWQVGDKVYNTSPVAGGSIGWVCTVAGSPGTWKSFGTIEV